MQQVPTDDIQKVIFDKNYIKFTKQRQAAQEATEGERNGLAPTTGYYNPGV